LDDRLAPSICCSDFRQNDLCNKNFRESAFPAKGFQFLLFVAAIFGVIYPHARSLETALARLNSRYPHDRHTLLAWKPYRCGLVSYPVIG